MSTQRILLFCTLTSSLLSGCASLFDRQDPAPVYQGGQTVYTEPAPIAAPTPEPPPTPQESNGVQTQALEIPAEPTLSPIEIPQEPQQAAEQVLPTIPDIAPGTATTEPPATGTPEQGQLPTPTTEPQPVIAPPPPPPPMAFEPLQSFAPSSPAVGALMIAANKDSQKGNNEAATATIERAIRIEPRNAALYYKLAVIKLDQSKPRLAEDLAKKALSLTGKDNALKKHCWLLIAKARDLQKNTAGAKEAKDKADKL
ncbi:hypothetical protein JCM14076_07500 [Methylosoma difficile]